MQRSKSLHITHIASGEFCRSLPSQKWTPWFEHYCIWGISFEKYKCLCNLWNESGIWKWHVLSSFASQGLSSLFEIFLPFLQKVQRGTSLLQGYESCQIASQQGLLWARKQDPRKMRSCTCLWLSFAHLVLHEQGQILCLPLKKKKKN